MRNRYRAIHPALTLLLSGAWLSVAAAAPSGHVEVGVGFVDGSDERFGRYTGLTERGGALLLDLSLATPTTPESNAGYWRVDGYQLGDDLRRYRLELGEQGVQRLRLDYRELTSRYGSELLTPFLGAGGDTLTLPAGWAASGNTTAGFTALAQNLTGFDLEQQRRRLTLAWQYQLDAQWRLNASFRHETRDGSRLLGGVTGYSGGNSRAALLPAPLDFETQVAEIALGWQRPRLQWSASYHAAFFNNGDAGLGWPTPYGRHPQWAAGVGFDDGYNRLALEPDNQYHQLRLNAAAQLAPTTRLQGDLAVGRMLQDARFLAYTANELLTVTTPLPRHSLDGRIDTVNAGLRLSARPLPKLNLVTRLRYRDRDNRTAADIYQRVRGDAEAQQAFDDGRVNRPYGLRTSQLGLDASYRLQPRLRLEAGYDYRDTERDFSEIEQSREQGFSAGLRTTLDALALKLAFRHEQRRTDRYDGNRPLVATHLPGTIAADDFENHPLLRKYYLAERDRDQLRLRGDLLLHETLSLGLSAGWSEDDYLDDGFGLNNARVLSLATDLSWAPTQQLRLSLFASRDRYDSEQSGRSFRGTVPADLTNPARNWQVDARDRFDSAGLELELPDAGGWLPGWRALGLAGELTLKAGYHHARSRGEIDVDSGPALTTAPLPDLQTRLDNFHLQARYQLSQAASLRLAFEHERYRSSDFAFDGIGLTTASNVLLVGEQSPRYRANWVTLAWRLAL
jgi:MtrB/PioB family decaheme-associated outer membrane protein